MVDTRDTAALRRHYEIEKQLANQLRAAAPGERPRLYRDVYNELFRRVPDHPQNTWKASPSEQEFRTQQQLRLLGRFLNPHSVYLEIGAGDCSLARAIAGRVRFAYGVDVSEFIATAQSCPSNFAPLLSDGTSIPAISASVDVAYSNMLIEHLHPDDVDRHLLEVSRVLTPGGVYVCRTPHRFTGPQDISQFFDREATGLHLKEYTVRELTARFRAAGFARIETLAEVKGRSICCPALMARLLESTLGFVPQPLRKRLCQAAPLRPMFRTITVVARRSVDTIRMNPR